MFDIAPTELLVCAVIALLVIGPKDLPNALRFVGRWVGKARRMAGTFRTGIDTMMREAELKEMEEKWRAHNEAIMQAHPQIGADYAATVSPVAEPAPQTTSSVTPQQNSIAEP
jgi:sec-independent protein translocase protein TatB